MNNNDNPCTKLWHLWTWLTVCLCPLALGQPEQTSPTRVSANDMVLANLPNTESTRSIWRDRTSMSPADGQDMQSKKKLQDTLRKLKSLQFTDLSEPEVQAAPQKSDEPGANTTPQLPDTRPVIFVRTVAPDVPEAPNDVAQSESTLTEETTEALRVLAQSPEKLRRPEALGQILFQGKAWLEAGLCYEESLKRLNAKSMAPSEDKAWLLLQIGNCLQQSDPERAMRIYKQLISEYPHSLWSELVRVKGQWITWELRDKPKTLISEIKTDTLQKAKR
jgi:tetratricopeptide (TPR) repeat protein